MFKTKTIAGREGLQLLRPLFVKFFLLIFVFFVSFVGRISSSELYSFLYFSRIKANGNYATFNFYFNCFPFRFR